jgi:tyrosinase
MKPFGYTYPEINDWSQTPDELKSSVSATVNFLYNANGQNSRIKRATTGDTEWFVETSVNRWALGTTFTIFVFLGDLPKDPKDYALASNLAGISTALASNQPIGSMPVALTYGEIALRQSLDKAGVASEDIASYLTNNLQWNVVLANGTVIPNDQIDTLNVWVEEESVTPAPDATSFPTYHSPVRHGEITRGKAGGGGT